MTLSSVLVLAHALVAIVFIAGLIGRWVTLGAAARATDLPAVRALTRASAPFERMVTLGSMILLALGIAAAIALGRPFLGPFQGGSVDWLFVSLVVYVSVVPLVPLVFLPKGRIFAAALEAAEARGEYTPELRAAFHDPLTRAAHVYEAAAVTVVLVLMLTKPF
ncbi:MAG TPA: DUF2269 family protein [Candidatus Limnocylindrales bacterium]|nr:DUF2269 family protein [Candidatus Limnocylindrales bacterium]